jgi:hypothetical protein
MNENESTKSALRMIVTSSDESIHILCDLSKWNDCLDEVGFSINIMNEIYHFLFNYKLLI